MAARSPIVVFSHLRWNFVYQRPQQLLSRLAQRRPVLFIEEPQESAELTAKWDRREAAPNVTVLVPSIPAETFSPRFEGRELKRLVRDLAGSEVPSDAIVWMYTPSAVDLLDELEYSLLIYDCMDELSAFLHAPKELREQESKLLTMADVVFTGGPSLYRAKRDRHRAVYCFPSSVDVEHFQSGLQDLPEPEDQAGIGHPRLGYFGVIDERIDLPLLSELADRRPHWQIVMVGPVVKIDPGTLPQRHNLHYLGGKAYPDLPAYVKGWDVCLMPFAINEATKFISPTKVLEYMAANKPIVSSPITDVVEPYSTIVRIGSTPEGFIRECEAALHPPEKDWATRQAGMQKVLRATSWDKTAAAMEALMQPSAAVAGAQ